MGISQSLNGSCAEVEYRVKGVAAHGLNLVGDERRALVIGHVEEAVDRPRAPVIIAERTADVGLLCPVRLYLTAQQRAGHLVQGGVVKDGAAVDSALDVELAVKG